VKQWLAKEGRGRKVQSGRVERRGVPIWSKKESSPLERSCSAGDKGRGGEGEGSPASLAPAVDESWVGQERARVRVRGATKYSRKERP